MTVKVPKLPKHLAITGRVESFLNDPRGRLPVSCTVFVTEPFYLGKDGIADSLKFVSYALRYGAGVAVHLYKLFKVENEFSCLTAFPKFTPSFYLSPSHPEYEQFIECPRTIDGIPEEAYKQGRVVRVADSMESKEGLDVSIEDSWIRLFEAALSDENDIIFDLSALRPVNTDNGRGLVASGAVSFLRIALSIVDFLNEGDFASLAKVYSCLNEVLRRGGLYKNGAVVLHMDHDNPFAEEFINLRRSDVPWARLALNVDERVFSNPLLMDILAKVGSGDLFLVKKQYDSAGRRIHHNVCLEILLPHRGTCLLSHVNLGSTLIPEIEDAIVQGMEWLCQFHSVTGVDDPYLSPDQDRQVGLGFLGLANLLARVKVSYAEFVTALRKVIEDFKNNQWDRHRYQTDAERVADAIFSGIQKAAKIAKSYGMERAFTIAPTASCSYRYKDSEGYVTTPEISPPVDRRVIRVSETAEQLVVEYPSNVEIADEVGFDTYFELIDTWQTMMNLTGLAHSISANWWSDRVKMNVDFLYKWMTSQWRSLYYALPVEPSDEIDLSMLLNLEGEEGDAFGCSLDYCSACAE